MRKFVIILIVFLAVVTFIRAFDNSAALKMEGAAFGNRELSDGTARYDG